MLTVCRWTGGTVKALSENLRAFLVRLIHGLGLSTVSFLMKGG